MNFGCVVLAGNKVVAGHDRRSGELWHGIDLLTLNTSNFKTVFNDDFGNDQSLSGLLWADRWGNADQFTFGNGALTLTGMQSENWNPAGFMQAPVGKSAGEGYGLYQFTGYANAGQGTGICFIMWRADNVLVDPTMPNVATEIDILESWDGTKTGQSTVHYYDPGWANQDGQSYNQYSLNLSVSHTYSMDWERGSLTFYVDGQQIYQDTVHAPLDYADGGSNEVMGAQVLSELNNVTTSTVQLHITDMSYSAPIVTSPLLPNPVPSKPVTGGSTLVTLGGGTQDYAASAGATVQAGSGNDTITASEGLVTVTGSSGKLTFVGGSGPSQVVGGSGSATITGGTGGGSYTGGANGGNVLVSQGAAGSNTTLTGGGWGDSLYGSADGNDVIVAARGRESILGGGGNTTIVGGGTAASVIFTGSGNTVLFGGVAGGDIVVGGGGRLTVTAQKGDAVFGNAGALTVSGSTTGADSIIGGAGPLTVNGRGGNMLVVAGTTNSNIQTGNGASLVFGGSGNTALTGGAGSMQVMIGSGNLGIQEGSGPTTYDIVKGGAGGTGVLYGFRPGVDKIDLFGYQPSESQVTQGSGFTLLSLSDGTKIQIVGVAGLGNSVNG